MVWLGAEPQTAYFPMLGFGVGQNVSAVASSVRREQEKPSQYCAFQPAAGFFKFVKLSTMVMLETVIPPKSGDELQRLILKLTTSPTFNKEATNGRESVWLLQ